MKGLVICAAMLQGVAPPAKSPPPQTLDAKSNRDAYAIYATVLQRMETRRPTTLLVQQETESNAAMMGPGCATFLPTLTGEWAAVAADLRRQNTHERRLQRAIPMKKPYRLIGRAEIQADDARLAKKHGRGWQRTPGSLDYAAVSVIGFNRDRTKAMVYVRSRTDGGIVRLELKGGSWVDAAGEVCRWIA